MTTTVDVVVDTTVVVRVTVLVSVTLEVTVTVDGSVCVCVCVCVQEFTLKYIYDRVLYSNSTQVMYPFRVNYKSCTQMHALPGKKTCSSKHHPILYYKGYPK